MAMRPGTSAMGMARPMSSRLGAVPQTGVRPGTGMRMGIGVGGAAVQRMPAVTSHGVPSTSHGGAAAGGGLGRAVQDRSFYTGQLRAKIAELVSEMDSMRREIAQVEQDQREAASLQRRQGELRDEVGRLQGQLADHNVLLDKLRTTPDLATGDMAGEASRLAEQNDADRGRCDAIFSERAQRERETAEAERQTAELRERFQQEIGRMSEEQQAAYYALKQANEEALGGLRTGRAQLDAVRAEAGQLEARMKGDVNRQKALGLYEEIHRLRKKRDQLAADLNQPQLSIAEERDQLLQHIKLVNQAIAAITRQISDTEQEATSLREQMAQMNEELHETPENAERRKKLAEARARDKEMTEFLARAPTMRQELAQQKARLEWTILALLEHLSRRAPEASRAREVHESLEAKVGQVANGEQTQEKLQEVLEQRRAELAKMDSMEEKLAAEIQTTRERTEQMQQELEVFSGAASLREDIERKRERLAQDKAWMVRQKEVMAHEASAIEAAAEDAGHRCSSDETHAQLEVLERQLRHQEQQLFQLREYVESKSSEVDYKPVAADVAALVTELNQTLVQTSTAF